MKKKIILIIIIGILFISKNYAQPTIINRGDLAILGVNAAYNGTSRDEISFVCFKDITPGTELQILDVGYGNCLNGFWSGGQEGGAKLTRTTTTLPAGTVVTFRTAPFAFANPDNNWLVSDLFVHPTTPNNSVLAGDFNINSGGDQLYIAQGGTWTEQASLCTINGTRTSPNAIFPGNNGRILFSFSTNGWQANAGAQSSSESMLFPGMNCFSMSPTNGTAWNKYNGPFTAATQTQWIERISNNSYWQSYTSSNLYNSNGQSFIAGLTLSINPGGGIPTATWTATSAAICSYASPIDLNTLITGTTGGTWSGTGVTGNTFNPAGLSGSYNITYTINYVSGSSSCPIAQTSSMNVVNNAAPTVTSLYNYCQNASATALVATGSNLLWYTTPIGGTGTSVATTPTTTTVGTTNYYVSQTINSCESPRSLITVKVSESPTINPVSNQSICVNTSTAAINFSGNGLATYNWTNNNTSIGLAASGTGNIAAFTGLNVTSSPSIATITATPVSTGYAYVPNYGTLLSPGNAVSVINTSTNNVVGSVIVGSSPFGVSVSNDGSRVYVSNYRSNNVSVINTFTNIVTNTISVGSLPMGIVVSPDGTRVYVANQLSNSVSIINASTNAVITSIPVSLQPQGITISPDGTRVYVANVNSNNISIINTTTNTVLGVIGVGVQPISVAISPDGSRLYVTNFGSNHVSVINTSTNTVLTTVATGSNPNGIAVSPDGLQVYVTNQNSSNVTVINASTNAVTNTIAVGTNPQGVSFTADALKAYVSNFGSNNVSVINTISNAVINTVTVGSVPHALGNFITPSLGCTGSSTTFTITVNPTPTVSINYTGSPFCAIGSQLPTIVGPTNGTFSSTTGLIINSTTGEIDLANSTPNAYTITYSVNAGCPTTAIANIVINSASSAPTIVVTQPTCTNNKGTITVSNPIGSGYSYSIDGIDYSNTNGIFNNVSTNTYSVTVKNSNNCISLPSNAIVNAALAIPIVPTATVTQPSCSVPNGSIAITSPIGSGYTYSIDGINFQANTTFNNLLPNNYTITVKNGVGCINTNTFIVNPNSSAATPTFILIQPTCTSTTVNITYTSPIGANYTYSIDGTTFQTSPTFNNIGNGTYNFIVKDLNTSCLLNAGIRNIAVTPNVPPPPTATTTIQYCKNAASLQLSATGTNLLWYNSPTSTISSTTAPTPNTSNVGVTTYYVSQTISNCESNRTAITVTVEALPAIPTITSNNGFIICGGTSITLSTTSPLVLQWYKDGTELTGQNNNTLLVTQAGNYTVKATNNAGCSSVSTSTTISIGITPIVSAGPDKIVQPTDSVQLFSSVSGGNTFTYLWSPSTYLSNNSIANPWVVKPLANSTYTLTVTNNNGCKASSTVQVKIVSKLIIPNAFSPNGDGVNETWEIQGLNLFSFCSVEIFNRNGQIVYKSIGYNKPWDGTRNGKPLPVGIYYFVIDKKDGTNKLSGWISLMR
ncbi:MAG: gliding motility-associated C-terminal domain-containing protein [Chitinophagaceae bacterium]|nr:gliding motility-associated C-terminal domain-containing protein [Chitinophagaceae bacterium]